MKLHYEGSEDRENLETADPRDYDYISKEYLESLEDRGQLLKEMIISWRSMIIVLNTRSRNRVIGGKSLVKFSTEEGQGMVLMRLDREEGVTQTKLAKELDIKPQTLGTHLKKLEEQGLVSRQKDADDGRALRVSLTKKGKKALLALKTEEEYSGSMFECFTTEELVRFKYLVEKLDRRLREEIEASSNVDKLLEK